MDAPRTSEIRAPTGLDRGARLVLMKKVTEDGGPRFPSEWLNRYFTGRFSDLSDYVQAVRSAHGPTAGAAVANAATVAEGAGRDQSRAALIAMPEGDFLEALELGMRDSGRTYGLEYPYSTTVEGVNAICQGRGIPYKYENGRFRWVGDPEVEIEAIVPAVSVLADDRLAGARDEFEHARRELTTNSQGSRKQAVAEACNAVESAMKVLAKETGVSLDPKRQGASALFNTLKEAGALDSYMENVLTAAARIGNPKGRHGAGELPHDVSEPVASAAVAAAAVAITHIGKVLPEDATD